jgi:acyl-CoA hydrolase
VVTVFVSSLEFKKPVHVGDLVTFESQITYVGKTSMETEVRVEAENMQTGEKTHTNSAYLVYVALDKNKRPTQVPPLILETEEERKRFEEGKKRQAERVKK